MVEIDIIISWRLEHISQNIENKPTGSSQSHHFFQDEIITWCTRKNSIINITVVIIFHSYMYMLFVCVKRPPSFPRWDNKVNLYCIAFFNWFRQSKCANVTGWSEVTWHCTLYMNFGSRLIVYYSIDISALCIQSVKSKNQINCSISVTQEYHLLIFFLFKA